MDQENLKADGIIDGSRTVAAIGTTVPTPASLPSLATTPVRTGTATSGSVLLLKLPEDTQSLIARPAQTKLSKGPLSLGQNPENNIDHLRPERAEAGLFDKICDFRELYDAWKRARSGKRSNPSVARFACSLESHLITLQNELIWQTWHPGEYEVFKVYEPKERTIYAPAFRDRVIHHSIHKALLAVYDPLFIGRSYACREGKGTHLGAAKAQSLLAKYHRTEVACYALKADIKKYFDNIDHAILKNLLRKRIQCEKTLWLCDLIIDTAPGSNGVGLPLGNLTSQLFANVYLHELDVEMRKIGMAPHYIRYMDDFTIIHHDKQMLHTLLKHAKSFLHEQLKLSLNAKTAILPMRSGCPLDFLGYRTYATHRTLRRRAVVKGRKYAAKLADYPDSTEALDRLTSWYAHARHAEPTGMMRKIFEILTQKKDAHAN